ncbi:MAG: hypothetical protein HZA24_00735 [Nitrospirae bacterium]|nr:hypothetical protein [Nitrospirota bacterium]
MTTANTLAKRGAGRRGWLLAAALGVALTALAAQPVQSAEPPQPVRGAELPKPVQPAEPPQPVRGAELPKPVQSAEPPQPVRGAELPKPVQSAEPPQPVRADLPKPIRAGEPTEQMVTMDFNQVDLPTFVKFVSELTKQNFAIDERVKGKVTIYAPKRIPVSHVYSVFEQVLELKGFGLVESENVVQVLPLTDMPPIRDIQVYYLQNANADEMSKVLTGIVSRSVQSAVRRPRTGAATGGQEFEGVVQVLADPATNALIITASPKDYKMLREVIDKLDIKRRQVYVEAVVMEVSVGNSADVGVEAFAIEPFDANRYTVFGGSITSGNAGGLLTPDALAKRVSSFSGLSFGAVRQFTIGGQDFFSVGGLIQAVAGNSDVNVLSTPQILTSDNQKAEIVVGDNVPIITSQGLSSGGNVSNTIERQDIGITLRLTPQILESNLVKLDLFQEISNVRTDAPSGFDINTQGVITSKKSATTTVIVKDKQTVVVGGLMSESTRNTIKKVPLLGDIPVLGWLFKSRSQATEKRNLLIFLTPHLIRDPDELFALQQAKSSEMIGFINQQHVKDKASRLKFLEQAINTP